MAGPIRDPNQAFQQLEAVMLRQMLHSSGAFTASDSPGAQLRTDMFIETLADAVAKAGGLGIARMLEKQLGKAATAGAGDGKNAPGSTPGAHPFTSGTAIGGLPALSALQGLGPSYGVPASRGGAAAMGAIGSRVALPVGPGAGGGVIDDLDDPNSERPLPEDPSAASIDDYQIAAPASAPAASPAVHAPHPAAAAGPSHSPARFHILDHMPSAGHPSSSLSPLPASGLLPNLSAHALNRYRERDESIRGGTTSGSSVGEKP